MSLWIRHCRDQPITLKLCHELRYLNLFLGYLNSIDTSSSRIYEKCITLVLADPIVSAVILQITPGELTGVRARGTIVKLLTALFVR